ncbi:MAG: hypothetical protein V4479_14725 [Actinomycetota bacterium]
MSSLDQDTPGDSVILIDELRFRIAALLVNLRPEAYLAALEGLREAARDHPQVVLENAMTVLSESERGFISADDWVLIATVSRWSAALYNFAAAMWERGGHEAVAVAAFREAIQQGSRQAPAALGEVLTFIGEDEEGFALIRSVIRGKLPGWRHAAAALAVALYETKSGSMEEIARLLATDSRNLDEDQRTIRARAIAASGHVSRGRRMLRREVRSGSVAAPIVLGNLLAQFGDDQGAEEMYRIGIERGDAFSAFNLGLMLDRLARTSEATEMFSLAAAGGDEAAAHWLRERSIEP